MGKKIAVVDADIDFRVLAGGESRHVERFNPGGFVSTEYYYEVGDAEFAELAGLNVFFSQFGDRSVLDVLSGKTPFDGISNGMTSLAKREIDGSKKGHSSKMKDAFASAGDVDAVIRVCCTQELFTRWDNGVRMFCRSFYVDPETLEQTPAARSPRPVERPRPEEKAVRHLGQLLEFAALRKGMHQKATVTKTYDVRALAPKRDYDAFSTEIVSAGTDFEKAFARATAWVKRKYESGELELDRSLLRVAAKNYGSSRNAKLPTEGVAEFRNPRAGADRADIFLNGKRLTVRRGQPVALFVVEPVVSRRNQYELGESAYADVAARMMDGLL